MNETQVGRVVPWALALMLASGCSLRPGPGSDPYLAAVAPGVAPVGATVAGPGGTSRTVAAYRDARGVVTDFVVGEMLVRPRDARDLPLLAERFGATVVSDDAAPPPPPGSGLDFDPGDPRLEPQRFLLRFDPAVASPEWVSADGAIRGMRGRHGFSSADGAKTLALITQQRLAGLRIMPNFVTYPDDLIFHTAEANNLDAFAEPGFNGQGVSNGATVTRAWQLMASWHGDEEVAAVAIIDGGFWLDAAGDAMVGPLGTDLPFLMQYDFLDDDWTAGGVSPGSCGNSPCPWHGNGTAGVAVGALDNGGGFGGTGGMNPFPFLYKTDFSVAANLRALRTAGVWGASVVNMSYSWFCGSDCQEYVDEFQGDFDDVGSQAVLVASAGNNGIDLGIATKHPCGLDGVLCVGALENGTNVHKDYSNYGGDVDLWAPTEIRVMSNEDTQPNLAVHGGTSAAAPYVAGVASMMKRVNPGLSSHGVEAMMVATAHQGSSSARVTRYLDAYEAVWAAMGESLPPDSLEPSEPQAPYPYVVMGHLYDELTVGPPNLWDVYEISVPTFRSWSVELGHMRESLGDMLCSIRRSDGSPPVIPISTGSLAWPDRTRCTASMLPPGTWHVIVSSATPQEYSMTMALGPVVVLPDQFEVNDMFADATPLPQGTFTVSLHDDEDVDAYVVTAAGYPESLGGFHTLAVQGSDRPVTIKFGRKITMNNMPAMEILDTRFDTDAQFDLGFGDAGQTFYIRVSGQATRYQVYQAAGYDPN